MTVAELKNCGNCKHRGDDPVEGRWGDKPTRTFYECKRIAHDDAYKYKPGGEAVVVDGSGYCALLCVEKTFYCKLWEANQ